MRIDVRTEQGIPVLAPSGRVTIGPTAVVLKGAIEAALRQGTTHLIVDGSAVAYMDSTGLGELIAAARTLEERGGRLGICSATPKLREILDVTGLAAVFLLGADAPAVATALQPVTR